MKTVANFKQAHQDAARRFANSFWEWVKLRRRIFELWAVAEPDGDGDRPPRLKKLETYRFRKSNRRQSNKSKPLRNWRRFSQEHEEGQREEIYT